MKQKKVSRALMVILFSMIFIVTYKTIAYAANVNGSITSANAVVGENVTLTVNLSSSVEIFGFDVHIQYDSSKLDFVSGSSDIASVNGGNGRIILYSDTCSSKNVTATLVFKAKEAGSHNVYLTADSSVYDNDVVKMNLVASTGVITATSEAPVSADNNLKDLTVYVEDENGNTTNGWFWPAFNKDTTQYYLNVEGNAKKLAITANANSGTSTVSLNNPELVVGNNNITITVKAQDGSTKNYVIAVTKAERETESESQTESKNPDETTGSNQNTSNKKVTIGDKTYTITDYNNEMTLPEGYEIIDYDYKGNNIKALKGLGTGLIIVAFVDDTSNVQGFLYDETADDFYKFITANVKSAQYVLVDMPSVVEGVNIPANYTLSSINYDNSVLVAYVSGDSKIYIVSAIDCNGKKGLYYLDSENNTIMRYFENENAINTNTNTNNNSNSDELYKVKTQSRIILIISVTIGMVMLGVILALVVSRKNSKDEDLDDEYDDELDEEYDDDEYEEEQEEEYDEDEDEEELEEEYDEDEGEEELEEEYNENEGEEEQEEEYDEDENEGEQEKQEEEYDEDKNEGELEEKYAENEAEKKQEADNDKNNTGEELNKENDKNNAEEELNEENDKSNVEEEVNKENDESNGEKELDKENDKSNDKKELNEENNKSNVEEELNKENNKDEKTVEVEKSDNKSEDNKSTEKAEKVDNAEKADNTELEKPMSNSEKVKELLEDDSTSLKEDELDMVLDELLSDILDGDNK